MRRTSIIVAFFVLIAAACSGSDDNVQETDTAEKQPDETAVETDGTPISADSSVEQVIASLPVPAVVDAAASGTCGRYGYLCGVSDASPEQVAVTKSAAMTVSDAMAASDDASEQIRLGLIALAEIDGVGHIEYDREAASMLAFTIDNGFRTAVFTVASEPQDDGEIPPIDETFVPPPGEVGPTGFRSVRASHQRYEPAGGPANSNRKAAVFNPFNWESAAGIAAIFQAEDEYATVDVFNDADVNPFTIGAVGGYDAVHIITHGGGSCPSWTDDRDECSSTFVGGPASSAIEEAFLSQDNPPPAAFHNLCTSGGVWRYCFESSGFAPNPNGIVFFGACGSDFGFNNTGAGASVGWTGTTQRYVAERTATKFWTLMVTEGLEFDLAKEKVQGGGYDNHSATYWASGGAVHPLTSSAFQGRNLRARDVVEMRLDGNEPQGQPLQFNGLPQDGNAETFPAKDQVIVFKLEGVRSGTQAGVKFEIRGDGTKWDADITLPDHGTIIEEKEGYATWQVTLNPDQVSIPDLSWSDLSPTRAPVELEIRAFQNQSEYTAYRGTVRLGTDVEFSGEIPIYRELENGMPPNGRIEGNDLRVMINTASGELSGSMKVVMYASDLRVGEWTINLTGTYDPETSAVEGTADGASEGGVGGISVSDSGSGRFEGSANLPAESITIQIGISGQTQTYQGQIVS